VINDIPRKTDIHFFILPSPICNFAISNRSGPCALVTGF